MSEEFVTQEPATLADDLLEGVDAIAAYTGLRKRRLHYLLSCDQLPVTRLGRRIYARKSALDALFPQPAKAGSDVK